MKKGLFAILAALTVFALVMTGCPTEDSPKKGPEQVTISYELNLMDGAINPPAKPADKKITKGGALGEANLPNLTGPTGYELLGWSLDPDDKEELLDGTELIDEDTTLYAQWIDSTKMQVIFNLNKRDAPTPEAVEYLRGALLGSHDPAPRDGYTFGGWYTGARALSTDTKYEATTDLPTTVRRLPLYADWIVEDSVAATAVVTKPAVNATPEYVVVDNRFYAVYEFKLAEGARWADYESLTAEYQVDEFYWDIGNSAAGSRLMGNFKRQDFVPITTTAGKLLTVSDYGARNAAYILDTGAGDWKSVRDVYKNYNIGNAPSSYNDYFTVTYDINGGKKHTGFITANLPDPMAKGPFYFALGIASQGATPYGTPQKIRNIKLKAVVSTGKADVFATPLYLRQTETGESTAKEYPAYTGYSNKNGSASENLAYRGQVAPPIPTPEQAAPAADADFVYDLGASGAINSTAFSGAYGYSNDLIFKIEFPDGKNASSYAKYEVLATFYSSKPDDDDPELYVIPSADGLGQIVWTSDTSDAFDNGIGTTYNLDFKTGGAVEGGGGVDLPAALKYYPSTFDGFAIQNSSATVTYIRITSIKFFKKP